MNSLRHSVGDPEYVAENWQGTLFVFAMILVIYVFNVYTANMMPLLDNLLMILTFCHGRWWSLCSGPWLPINLARLSLSPAGRISEDGLAWG